MPVDVTVYNLGSPEKETELKAAIPKLFDDREDHWKVQVIGSQSNQAWVVTVDGSTHLKQRFEGPGQHNVDVILGAIKSALPKLPKKN